VVFSIYSKFIISEKTAFHGEKCFIGNKMIILKNITVGRTVYFGKSSVNLSTDSDEFGVKMADNSCWDLANIRETSEQKMDAKAAKALMIPMFAVQVFNYFMD
jgi:hypothetical protein